MFIRQDNSLFNFIDESNIEVPTSTEFIDCSISPYSENGCMSGSFVVATFASIANYRKSKAEKGKLANDTVKKKIYDIALQKDSLLQGSLVTACSAMQAMIENVDTFSNLSISDIIYVNSILMVKRILHKYHVVLLETTLTTSTTTLNGKFYIAEAGDIIPEASSLSKGFVGIGYDAEGIVVENTLGLKYGSLGFARISWDVFSLIFIKGIAVKNFYN